MAAFLSCFDYDSKRGYFSLYSEYGKHPTHKASLTESLPHEKENVPSGKIAAPYPILPLKKSERRREIAAYKSNHPAR